MATKRITKELSELELPDDSSENGAPNTVEDIELSAEVKELKKIEEVLGDAEVSGGTVRLERKGPSDLKWQYCGRFKVEDFSVDHIKQVFGGGDYKAQTFRAKGAFYKKFEFTIDYRYKGSMDIGTLPLVDKDKPEQAAMLAATAQANGSNQTMSMMMTMMDRATAQQNSQMMMMMNMMNETSKQNIAMMGGMFTALSAAMGKPAPDPSASMMPLLIEMVKSSSTGKGSDIQQVISAVRDLSALAKGEPAPKEEKEDDMFDKVLKYGGPIVTALLTKTPLQMPGVIAPQVPSGGPIIDMNNPQTPQVPVSTPSTPAQTEMLQKVNLYMEVLIGAAEKRSDPATYAELVSDMLTDEHFNVLIAELQSPDWFAKLASGNPRIIAQQAWFTGLRQELLAMVTDEPTTTTEPDVQPSTGSGA